VSRVDRLQIEIEDLHGFEHVSNLDRRVARLQAHDPLTLHAHALGEFRLGELSLEPPGFDDLPEPQDGLDECVPHSGHGASCPL